MVAVLLGAALVAASLSPSNASATDVPSSVHGSGSNANQCVLTVRLGNGDDLFEPSQDSALLTLEANGTRPSAVAGPITLTGTKAAVQLNPAFLQPFVDVGLLGDGAVVPSTITIDVDGNGTTDPVHTFTASQDLRIDVVGFVVQPIQATFELPDTEWAPVDDATPVVFQQISLRVGLEIDAFDGVIATLTCEPEDDFSFLTLPALVEPATTSTSTTTMFVPPGAPVSVVVTPGDKSVKVRWAPGPGGAPDYYGVTPSPGGVTKAVAGTSTVINGLRNGTRYTFEVRAVRNFVVSNPTVSKTVTPRTVPGKPSGVRSSLSGTTLKVSWTAPAANGAKIIASQVAVGPKTVTVQGEGRNATIPNIGAGTHTIRVHAKNAAGWGAWSTPASIVVAQQRPTFATRYTEAEWVNLAKTARFFDIPVSEVPKTGVAVLRYILAISGNPAPRPAAAPLNAGPRTITTTYSFEGKAATLDPVARYLALQSSATLKVGAALLQYLAAISGVR